METESILCEYCKKPVLPHEALPVELENDNGVPYTAVFHGTATRNCAPLYALERLKTIAVKLQDALLRLADAEKEMQELDKDKEKEKEEGDDDA